MPTVYWYCPKPETASGGVWFIHRLGAMLAKSGVASRVCQLKDGFDVWWDAHPTSPDLPLVINPELGGVPEVEGDTIVVPEVLWPMESRPGVRQILFLQNYIWLGGEARELIRSQRPEILVCSRYLANWCIRELAVRPIGILHPYLDDDVWAPTPKEANRVLMYARRSDEEFHMAERLEVAIESAGFPVWVVRQDVSQRQLRDLLDKAEFYVHHVEPEGFPMAALEAMRCGVIPVGTTGGGGNEFMFNDETALVAPGPKLGHYTDPDIFVKRVVSMLERLRGDADLRSRLWTKGHEWSLRYNAAATAAELAKVFHA